MNKKVWIYDIETLKNCFTYSAIDRDSNDIITFVIWKGKNEIDQLIKHFDECAGQIGFNNISFDYPVIHFIIKNYDKLRMYNGDQIAKRIYKEAQITINKQWSMVRNPIIPQLDLFKIHHFDNFARMTSLKKLEIAMQMDNVKDMPIAHDQNISNDNEVEMILDYNINDIVATKEFYKKSIKKIELRKSLYREYELDCLNYSDSKIGEELMLKLYCNETKQNPYYIKKSRTFRDKFSFKECIPEYVKYETDIFQDVLDYLEEIEVEELKGSFAYEFDYKGVPFHIGTGGIHAANKEGIYEADEDYVIIDSDVSSLYPSLAVVNSFYPRHLGEEFYKVYNEKLLIPRLKAKKEGNKTMADGFKLALNSVYGKSNSQYSFLCDPLYTLNTTLSGQLSLMMLSEMLGEGIAGIEIIQVNTDGITTKLKRCYTDYYYEICKEWEEITKLQLEHVDYSKFIMRDVNNYIAVGADGKVKRKGIFKLHDEMRSSGEYHKAFNHGVVPEALSEYYLNGTPVEKTIKSNKNILDFCKTFSTKGKFFAETLLMTEDGEEYDLKREQKTNRYYISNDGRYFRKRSVPIKPKYYFGKDKLSEEDEEYLLEIQDHIETEIESAIKDGVYEDRIQCLLKIRCDGELYSRLNKNFRFINKLYSVHTVELTRGEFEIDSDMCWRIISVESDDLVTIFNEKVHHDNFDDYDINYDYYIDECHKILEVISGEKEKRELKFKEKRLKEIKKKQEQNYIKYCINKLPTKRQYDLYVKDWLVEKYGVVEKFKPSPKRKVSVDI